MYLKRLEIHGFKSFANKTTMEFSQGVIAVVGPNGSGKSNVADSLRWVLGEQSAKMIRGKKSDDVIFAGSDKKTRMGFAEVVATFDNRDRRIPVDAPEVSIGRRIDRTGESEYLINNQKVRLLDIVDLVLKSNIGTSRYTVIGQGTIDQMILQGPSEVKNLLDEASGVKSYHIKRDKTLRRLEQTAQNLMRAEDLIREIEPRLKSLRRQAKKMEARAELEQELKIYQREFFGKTYWALKTEIDRYQAELNVMLEKRKDLERQIAEGRQELQSKETQGGSYAKLQREIQHSLDGLMAQKNKLLEDLSLVRGKMQSHKTAGTSDAKTLMVELHETESKIKELQAGIAKAEADLRAFQATIGEKTEVLQHLNSHLDALYRKLQNPQDLDWGAFGNELRALDEMVTRFYQDLGGLNDIEQVRLKAGALKAAYDKFSRLANEKLVSPQLQIQQIQQQLQAAQIQKDELQKVLQDLELSSTKAKLETDFLRRELKTSEQKHLQLQLELKKAQSASTEDFLSELVSEEKRVQAEMEILGKEIKQVEDGLKDYLNQQTDQAKQLRQIEAGLFKLQDELSKQKDKESGLSIEKAKFDTQMEVLCEEIGRILGLEIFDNIKQAHVSGTTPDLEQKILRLKNQLEMIGGMDELTLKEYQETEARYTNLSQQVEDLSKSMSDLRSIMDELDEHIKSKFNDAFHKVNEKFEHYFRLLFGGGRAVLSLVKEEEKLAEEGENTEEVEGETAQETLRPEEKIVKKYEHGASNIIGIDIKATPPGKKLTHIQALSGGERSLTSIALLCSMLTCFPSPFVVLDEVDAALDDANTIRFGQILGTLAHQTQFITITHNRETMAQSNILYGVTMGDDGVSKLLSVKLEQAKQFAK